MRLFVYEWVTGGGLAHHHGDLPASLLREGLAMAQAVAADAAACDGVEATLLRDRRAPSLVAPRAKVVEVDSASAHRLAFDEAVAHADTVLLIAPETDGALLDAAERVASVGGRLISPSPELIRVTGDKHETGERLRRAGAPTPEATELEPSAPLPDDFPYPAVIKPIDGAGSQDTRVVAGPHDRPPAYAWPRRLERFTPGVAVSVALVLTGDGDPIVLPPCRQRLSTDGRLTYLGGATPLADGLAERASALALRAAAALPPAVGYVGVDAVLGPAPDGGEDAVIEVNPRLTTSYVGLRAACRENLVAAMIAAADGESTPLTFDPRPIAFDADGAVYYEERAC